MTSVKDFPKLSARALAEAIRDKKISSVEATTESIARQRHKELVVEAGIDDIVVSPAITGTPASWLKQSLREVGYDPDNMGEKPARAYDSNKEMPARWSETFAAGQGVGSSKAIELPALPSKVLCSETALKAGAKLLPSAPRIFGPAASFLSDFEATATPKTRAAPAGIFLAAPPLAITKLRFSPIPDLLFFCSDIGPFVPLRLGYD